MKQIFLRITILIFVLFLASPVYADSGSKYFTGFEDGQTAVSVFLGQPSLVRYDYWLNWRSALFFDGGYHFDKYFYGAINLGIYFFNTRDFLKKKRSFWNSLQFYAGPGLFVGVAAEDTVNDSFKLGLRAFGGVEYLFDGQKFAIRAELAPTFILQGGTLLGLQGMLGLTYYFGSRSSAQEKSRPDPVVGEQREKSKTKKVKKSDDSDSESTEDDFDL